jgi:hypothetical protein
MSSRFEQIITGAVLTGAIAITGCSSSSSDSGDGNAGGTGEESPVVFLGARAVADNQIKLYFSDSIQLPEDLGALAGLFVLRANARDFLFEGNSERLCTDTDGSIGSESYYCVGSASYYANVEARYTFGSDGDVIGDVTSAVPDGEDDSRVILTIDGTISDGDDDGTGLLRLTYTGDESGLWDSEGNHLPAIALTSTVPGNVGAEVNGGPVLIDARMQSATSVRLTFNEPVSIPDGETAAAAANFLLALSCPTPISSPVGVLTGTDGQSVPWDNVLLYELASSATFSLSGAPTTAATAIAAPDGFENRLILTVPEVDDDDDSNGYLRLTYSGPDGTGDIEGAEGGTLQGFAPTANEQGNVVDPLTPSFPNACVT